MGIGTGYSTRIPSYKPTDVIDNVRMLLEKKPMKQMVPWYRDFEVCIHFTVFFYVIYTSDTQFNDHFGRERFYLMKIKRVLILYEPSGNFMIPS